MLPRLALLLAALTLAVPDRSAAEPPPTAKLNLLFLMVDDLRPELACYGNPHVRTPHIDALAAAGVRFDRAYCQYPLCNPSRASMLTGRQPTTTGVLDNRTWFGAAHPDFVSLSKHFRSNGYATLRAGKVFHGGIDDADAWTEGGEPRDFEGATSSQRTGPNYPQQSDRAIVLAGNGEAHGDYKTAERTIAYLRRYAEADQPFFLVCGFTKPHSPPTAPAKFFAMYDPAQVPLPPDFTPRPTAPEGFPLASVPPRNSDLFIDRDATPEAAREMIRAYWASLTWTDWNVGRVLARLGLRERTVIVFWGDHGYHLGEKGKWSKHGSLFEVGTRVPLIVAVPGAKGNGHASARVVQSLDLYPTLVALCGLPVPEGLQGRSLSPLLDDPGASWDHPAFTVIGSNNRLAGVAVRTERFRYAEYDGDRGGAMLFDHEADPHEMTNRADDPQLAAVRAELAGLVRKFRAGQTR